MAKATRCARVAAGALCLLLARDVNAGDVRGTVRSSEEPKRASVEAVRAPYWQEWNGFIEPKKPSIDYGREVSAVLVGAAETRDATLVSLRDGTLAPSTIVVQHGTQLRVRNDDDFAHELFAAELKGFEPRALGPGQTRTVPMEQTGVFALRDKLAPHVRGTLHVLPKLTQVVSPSADGSFVFRDVPDGRYVVKVFRGPHEVAVRELEVSGTRDVALEPVDVRPSDKQGK